MYERRGQQEQNRKKPRIRWNKSAEQRWRTMNKNNKKKKSRADVIWKKTFICRNRERERAKWYGNITDVASDDSHSRVYNALFPPRSNVYRVQHSTAETGSCQPCNQRLIETYSVTKILREKKETMTRIGWKEGRKIYVIWERENLKLSAKLTTF
jgi:hypothetical protein